MRHDIKIVKSTYEDLNIGAINFRGTSDRLLQNTPLQDEAIPFFPGVTGTSPELRQAVEKAARLANTNVSILLQGETGVGKEVFARGIHALSPQNGGPFIALNCGGLNRELLANELFGHVDGAFTGARRGGTAGKIEAADGGTLLLDELGEMPLDLQPHFLRVLEDGLVCRIGENTPRKVRFRLIAATNRDLRKEVEEGRFRADLFYRISVTSVAIPALRERRSDITVLARKFLRQFCCQHEVQEKVFDPKTLSQLEHHKWPGNIRELQNVIESLTLTSPTRVIEPADLPPEICSHKGSPTNMPMDSCSLQLHGLQRSEFEQICTALQKASGNATTAARELGIAKSTLYMKLKKYSLSESLHLWRSHPGNADQPLPERAPLKQCLPMPH